MAAGTFRSGKNSRITCGVTNLSYTKWSIKERGSVHDTTHFESSGSTEQLTGPTGCDIKFSGKWDAGQNPYTDPPALYRQDRYAPAAGIKFYSNTTDNTPWTFTAMTIESSEVTSDVNGMVEFMVEAKSIGSYVRPS